MYDARAANFGALYIIDRLNGFSHTCFRCRWKAIQPAPIQFSQWRVSQGELESRPRPTMEDAKVCLQARGCTYVLVVRTRATSAGRGPPVSMSPYHQYSSRNAPFTFYAMDTLARRWIEVPPAAWQVSWQQPLWDTLGAAAGAQRRRQKEGTVDFSADCDTSP